jgi:hypothetical protein
MLFGFGKKEEEKQALFKASLTDKEDLEEIKKIAIAGWSRMKCCWSPSSRE